MIMQNFSTHKILLSALAFFALPFSSLAEWSFLADFEDGNLDNWFFTNRLSIVPQDGTSHDGWNMIDNRPFDDAGGQVLAASEGTTWYNIYECVISLGEMSETEDYTIYYELAYNDDSGDLVVGVGDMKSPLAVGEGETHGWSVEEPAWGDFSILARFARNGLDVRDANGTGYTSDYGEQQVQTWYQIWYVVHPALYSWSMWIKGGAFTEQTHVADYHYFRKNDTNGVGPMRSLIFRLGGNSSSATTTGLPTYVDNIAVDTAGMNLNAPEAPSLGTWGPWDIADAEGNVNTESWMGWLNVANKPFVWSYDLESYIYIEEANIDSSGSWTYFFK